MTVTETADPVGLTLTSPELMTPAFVIDDAKLSANIARAKGRPQRSASLTVRT